MPSALPPNIIVTGSTAPRSNQEGLKTSDETLGKNKLFETTKQGVVLSSWELRNPTYGRGTSFKPAT